MYAIVVHNVPFAGEQQNQVKLVKVGFTHVSIEKDTNNRMEQLQKEIEKASQGTAKILFAWRIGALDIRPFHDIQDEIRGKVGVPVKKEKAAELNLPTPTEWALTTEEHIAKIKELKRSKEWEEIFDIFDSIEAPTIPEDYQDWLKEKRGKK